MSVTAARQRDRVLVVRLLGGLGNQLFQHAAGLSLARKWNARLAHLRRGDVGISIDGMLGQDLPNAGDDVLERVGRLPARHAEDRGRVPGAVRSFRRRAARRVRLRRGQIVNLTQAAEHAFEPMGFSPPTTRVDAIYLDGYFQHPSFFDDTYTEIARQLAAHVSDPGDLELGHNSTVISFRRGDYVRLGWELPLAYYEQAVKRLPVTDGPTWIISDDNLFANLAVSWFRERGIEAGPPPDLDVDPVRRDLRLLIAADRVVMANSTFCWWGTVAGDLVDRTTERLVIAPKAWLPPWALNSSFSQDGWP